MAQPIGAVRTLVLPLAMFCGLAMLPVSWDSGLECGATSENLESEFTIATGCGATPLEAYLEALRGLDALVAAGVGIYCIDSGCTPESCNPSVTYFEGDPDVDVYPSPTPPGYCADASYEGKVAVTCTECEPD